MVLTMANADSPLLKRLRLDLDRLYGARLDRVILFGSRARGDAREDSDYDVAVFLKDCGSFWQESGQLAELTTDILLETGAVISAKPFRVDTYEAQTPLMYEIRREEIDL